MDSRKTITTRGLRCTKQRLAIFDALRAANSHPTAEEVFAAVRSQCDGISLATVYNTLEALCAAGLCRRLPGTNGSARYDADLRPHFHVIDQDTGTYHDVPEELGRELLAHLPSAVLNSIENHLGVRLDRSSIHFLGRSNGHMTV